MSRVQLIVVGCSLYFPLSVEKEDRIKSFTGIYPSFQLSDLLNALLSGQTESLKRGIGSSYGKVSLTFNCGCYWAAYILLRSSSHRAPFLAVI